MGPRRAQLWTTAARGHREQVLSTRVGSWVAAPRAPRPSSCQPQEMRAGCGLGERGSPREPDLPRAPTVARTVTAGAAELVGVAPAADAACFPYLQALVGRVCPGARAAALGSAVAGAYSGGHLPRLLMKAARPSTRRPPRPRPPRPRPAPRAPGGCLCVARAPPAESAVLDPAHRVATSRVARLASP